MKIRSSTTPGKINHELQEALTIYRKKRSFNVSTYFDYKVALIKQYFEHYGLKNAVVAVSGGIDSAIVLALAKRVGIKVIPVVLPSYDNKGVTGQETAVSRAEELCASLNLNPVILNITPPVMFVEETVRSSLHDHVPQDSSDWARGQLVSYMRTPMLYYMNTLLTDNGQPSVLLGTTNYSEGSYLGYVGKASDGMVDLQVISDIYKSEVYDVAEYLHIPQSILNVAPTGDMFEDITDEEVFGASYDFVELFLSRKNHPEICPPLSERAEEEFMHYSQPLEDMHKYNKHKYLGASPAVHLDLREFPLNVWKTQNWRKP